MIMKMMTDTQRTILQNSLRYANCKLLDNPVKFCDMFANCDIPYVGLHSIETLGAPIECGLDECIVGFVGACVWKDGRVIPLDGDTYCKDMLVYGYEFWENLNEDGERERCLDILVWEDW